MDGSGLRAGDAARRLGVAVTTLRSWHQRYGLGPSAHEAGHHRRYTGDDMARLLLMQQLVAAGVTPADAARWARRTPLPESAIAPATAVSPDAGASPGADVSSGAGVSLGAGVSSAGVSSGAGVSSAARVSSGAGGSPDWPRPSGAPAPAGSVGGGGYALALGDADPAARGLGRAALRLDVLGVRDLVGAAIGQRGVVDTWDRVLRPVLRAVGDRAAAAEEMVEVEHIL
ncbi:MAG: MerR family transcriptional regulator, light-induced transcriptional regulator, partial [Micromonosporaceae bacterium]|nr:MerR family transcriptional regulator, light-induced transcriptional regulator [Micromonosporaceae bacterium]